jgi:tRNA A-37 threonylcarbamoyl transferase component Bud32/tetratricopeptide (TPR) repeat protein
MRARAGCIPEVELYQAFHGEVDPDQSAAVMRHVLSCSLCHETWRRFELDAQMARGIRAAVHGDVTGADAAAEAAGGEELPDELGIPGFTVEAGYIEGGQARVYRGVYEASQEDVAIKVFHNSALNEGGVARFSREFKSLARLRHPNVVPIRSDGQILGHPYFVMPWIEGLPLDQYIRDHKLIDRDVVRLIIKICGALVHAHGRGVLHLDLKPTNVRVDANGEPVVLDFGLARMAGADTDPVIPGLGVAGTPAYMAPEQVKDREDIDARADIYSLGLLMYEGLTGRRAKGQHIPPDETMGLQVALERPPRPREVRRGLDAELEAIVLKAIEPNRNKRYDTAEQFYDDLERYLSGRPVSAMGTAFRYLAAKAARRHAGPLLLCALLVLVLGFAAGMRLYFQRRFEEAVSRANQELALGAQELTRLSHLQVAREWEQLGEAYRRSGDAEPSEDCFRYARDVRAWVASKGETPRPEAPVLGPLSGVDQVVFQWGRLGEAYRRSGDMERADICFRYQQDLRTWAKSDGAVPAPEIPFP